MTRQYGAVASGSQGFSRLVQHFKAGLLKVRNCLADGTPLAGSSDNHIGIQELRLKCNLFSKLFPLLGV